MRSKGRCYIRPACKPISTSLAARCLFHVASKQTTFVERGFALSSPKGSTPSGPSEKARLAASVQVAVMVLTMPNDVRCSLKSTHGRFLFRCCGDNTDKGTSMSGRSNRPSQLGADHVLRTWFQGVNKSAPTLSLSSKQAHGKSPCNQSLSRHPNISAHNKKATLSLKNSG